MNLSSYSLSFVRTLASEKADSQIRTDARKELARRGVPFESHDKREMDARMGMPARRGTSAPCVRRDGRSQIFGGPPGAAGRQDRISKDEMDRRMGISSKTPEVRREGRTQIFETLTAEDAKRAIRASASK